MKAASRKDPAAPNRGWSILSGISSSDEHPSLTLRISPDQRDRAESLLKDAYADGRIDELDFDARISQVLGAVNRRQLNEAFYGLVELPAQLPAPARTQQPPTRPEPGPQAGRGAAAFAHFSTFLLWLFGPGLVYAASAPGSYARQEAAKAFNFQFVSSIVLVPMYILAGINGFGFFDWLLSLVGTAWLVLTIVGGVKAAKGEDWRNPAKAALKVEVLRER